MAGGSMFGYIVMNKPEIKFKDFDLYRSFLLRSLPGTERTLWGYRTDIPDI